MRGFSNMTCLSLSIVLFACGSQAGPSPSPVTGKDALKAEADDGTARELDADLGGWDANNRQRIDEMLAEYGNRNPQRNGRRPVAVFDWDNTVLKNDIGDATFFWMIKNSKFLQPPNGDWRATSRHLTAAAVQALNIACAPLSAPGAPVPSGTNAACADELVLVYDSGKTSAGAAAWVSQITYYNNAAYQWVAQLQAGYKPEDLNDFARAAFEENNANPVGTKQTIGTRTGYNHYVRIYPQMGDLAVKLQKNGFDVWVLTASPQEFVEPLAHLIGIDRNHVIGIRQIKDNGRLTYDTEGCGPFADGHNGVITFDEGKRCWINKVIFNEPQGSQLAVNPDPEKRPTFVAGDSDTDIAMIKDATALKLVLNRAKLQIVCNALNNYGGKWLFQRMFIAPRAQRTTAYPCSTALDAAGQVIVDEVGQTMSNMFEPY